MNKLIEKIQYLFEWNQPFVLATIAGKQGSAPRRTGTQMLVLADGTICGTIGGGHFEKTVIQAALRLFEACQDSRLDYNFDSGDASQPDMICGGHLQVELRYFTGNDLTQALASVQSPDQGRLLIFGAGHVGLAIARLAQFIGLATNVIDDRRDFCNAERFPQAECLVIPSFDDLSGLSCGPDDRVVIVTRGHAADRECLVWALQHAQSYIGLIGSRRKLALTYRYLTETLAIPESQLLRVHAPIGLDIGAETPEEIAVAVIAEIIQFKSHQKSNA